MASRGKDPSTEQKFLAGQFDLDLRSNVISDAWFPKITIKKNKTIESSGIGLN